MSEWPSIFCTDLRSAPPSRRCVAKLCLIVCGVRLIPAIFPSFLSACQNLCLVIGAPLFDRKRQGDCLFLSSRGLSSWIYFFIFSEARRFIGTTLSFEPLPMTLMNPPSKFMSLNFIAITSLALRPEEYNSSSIAESLVKKLLFSSVSSSFLISSRPRAFGRRSHCLGILRVSVGSSKMIFSIIRNLLKPFIVDMNLLILAAE